MKKYTLILSALLFPLINFSQEKGLDKKIDEALKPVSDSITNFIFDSFSFMGSDVPYIVCWLLIASFFFTFYYNFLN